MLFLLKYILLFSFCLTFYFSLNLGETVTCSGLAGAPCVGASLCNCVCSGALAGAGSDSSTGRIFSHVCWRPPPWWEVGVEPEGPEPEPGPSWGFSAQWLSLPCQRRDQGRRGWSRSPEGAGFLPGVLAVSASVGVWAQGLRPGGCTSVLVSLCPRCARAARGWA